MASKFLMFLGLCMRSGNVVSGEFACEKAIRAQKARLVLLAADASENTRKKFMDLTKQYQVEVMIIIETKQSLGDALGKAQRSVAAVMDEGFSKKLMEMAKDD